MIQQRQTITTVRLAPATRGRLKVMAAARTLTMEAALAEAIDLWTAQSVAKPGAKFNGKMREEASRMKAQVDLIAGSGNDRVIQSAMCMLDCMMLGL